MALQSKIADLGRLQEIVAVFTVAGFGDFFKRTVMRVGRLLAMAGITSALVIGTSIVISLTKKSKG